MASLSFEDQLKALQAEYTAVEAKTQTLCDEGDKISSEIKLGGDWHS